MKTAVRDVMTTRVIWVRKDAPFREMAAAPEDTVSRAARLMTRPATSSSSGCGMSRASWPSATASATCLSS